MADRRKRRLKILLAIAVLLAIGVFWWLRAGDPVSPPASAARKGSPAETHHTAPPAHHSSARPAARRAPMPEADAPLATAAPALQRRADAGDSLAACRLAMELLRCDQVEAALARFKATKRSIESMEAGGILEGAQMFADQVSWQLAQEKQCRTLPPALRSRTAHYLTQAARAGEPEAMLHYADAAHLGYLESLALHRAAEFDAWRRDAPGMLHRALQAGRPEAVFMLRMAYQTDFSAIGGLIENDAVEAQAYALMFAWLVRGTEQIDRSLNPQQMTRARKLADDRYRRLQGSLAIGPEPPQFFLVPPGQSSSGSARGFCGPGQAR